MSDDQKKIDSIDNLFSLANAWQLKGNYKAAEDAYLYILKIQPDYTKAYNQLGNLKLRLGDIHTAYDYYRCALKLQPDQPQIRRRHDYTKKVIEGSLPSKATPDFNQLISDQVNLKNNPDGKINLQNQFTTHAHRSGWKFVISLLEQLHNEQGVLFDGFIENNFAWRHRQAGVRSTHFLELAKHEGFMDLLTTSEEKGITPYQKPWVGFIHNPQNMPSWFHYQFSPQTIFAKDIWKRSLPYCIGLFTLSNYHADWIREQTKKPVSALIHPTEIPERIFDFDLFLSNPDKKVIQIGWWLRKLNAIYQLPLQKSNPLGYRKIRLIPGFSDNSDDHLKMLMEKEINIYHLQIEEKFTQNTTEIQHVSDDDFDRLLSKNIVFIDLYDTNANNTVVECIARATPLLINPHPATIEYLGEEYPFFFTDYEEAAEKALNLELIHKTHQYLKGCSTRFKLEGSYFLDTFKESEVYQRISL